MKPRFTTDLMQMTNRKYKLEKITSLSDRWDDSPLIDAEFRHGTAQGRTSILIFCLLTRLYSHATLCWSQNTFQIA